MIPAQFLWGNEVLREDQWTDVKNSNFDIFESALYLKCGSVPLRIVVNGIIRMDRIQCDYVSFGN